jgi:hypothetical protein
MKNDTMEKTEFKAEDWLRRIIEGVGGMNDYEKYELVLWNEPERTAGARWALKCLANPKCEGSAEMLDAIIKQREANP